MRFIKPREITALVRTASKSFNVGMHSNIYGLICFKLGMMIHTTVSFIASLSDLDFDSKSRRCRKAKNVFDKPHTHFIK